MLFPEMAGHHTIIKSLKQHCVGGGRGGKSRKTKIRTKKVYKYQVFCPRL